MGETRVSSVPGTSRTNYLVCELVVRNFFGLLVDRSAALALVPAGRERMQHEQPSPGLVSACREVCLQAHSVSKQPTDGELAGWVLASRSLRLRRRSPSTCRP